MYMCIYIYIYMYVCICVYIYIYTHIHTYIHTHTHTHTVRVILHYITSHYFKGVHISNDGREFSPRAPLRQLARGRWK